MYFDKLLFFSCTNFREWQAIEIDKYHCPRCSPIIGPSIRKRPLHRTILSIKYYSILDKVIQNSHRHDYWDANASHKPVQTGTPAFIQELKSRHFIMADEILVKMPGYELTEEFFQTKGFNNPILIENKEGLDMIMPSDHFSYIDVLNLIGDDKEIDVIDVCRQANIRMTLRDFVEYFVNNVRTRIFNVVSLEFSDTR